MECSTSIAANYRAACLARSGKEWVAKLGVVREEADEALFWLIFIHRAGIATGRDVGEMLERPVNWPACLAQPIEQVPMANGSAPAGR